MMNEPKWTRVVGPPPRGNNTADILAPRLSVVFVGINPSIYSVAQGHYFARPPIVFGPRSRGRASASRHEKDSGAQSSLPKTTLHVPFWLGFTDIVKTPTASAAELRDADFAVGAPQLRAKLEHLAPRIACFQGATALRPFLRHALGVRAGYARFRDAAISCRGHHILSDAEPEPGQRALSAR